MRIDKQLQLSAQYSIDGQSIAFFNAQVQENGSCSSNKSVMDEMGYRNNRDAVNAAFSEFEDQIYEIADKVKSEGLCN